MNDTDCHSKRPQYAKTLNKLLTYESRPKLGLERIRAILDALQKPEQRFKSIHVAGTNGKGSTCAFLNSLAMKKFQKIGLYTSPHLLCARERIQINGELISERLFCEAEAAISEAAERINEQPTFFERMTAMAFWIFAKEKVDFAIIEVGLGGRLDATNVITPVACVITRVDLDHIQILGNTLKEIAGEKAGIIKEGIPVITGWQETSVLQTISDAAKRKKAQLTVLTEPCGLPLSLLGDHQNQNASLALAAFKEIEPKFNEADVREALLATTWPCRLELIQSSPPILLDGAHNASGMQALVKEVSTHPDWKTLPIILVLGTTQGHQAEDLVQELLPLKGRIIETIATESQSPRALPSQILTKILTQHFICTETTSVPKALKLAQQNGRNALIVVAGSLYVAGEARALFRKMPIDDALPIF